MGMKVASSMTSKIEKSAFWSTKLRWGSLPYTGEWNKDNPATNIKPNDPMFNAGKMK